MAAYPKCSQVLLFTPALRIANMREIDPDRICYWPEMIRTSVKAADDVVRTTDKEWWLYLPQCGTGRLSKHSIIEHDDGTITVNPSIVMEGHDNGVKTAKHGFLEKGIWRDA